MDMKDFGSRIRQVRKALGLTQKEVVEQIGIPLSPYNRLERGENCNWDKALLVLAYYSQKVSLDLLFSDHFDVVEDDELFSKNYELNQVAKVRLELLRQQLHKETEKRKAAIDDSERALQQSISQLEEIL